MNCKKHRSDRWSFEEKNFEPMVRYYRKTIFFLGGGPWSILSVKKENILTDIDTIGGQHERRYQSIVSVLICCSELLKLRKQRYILQWKAAENESKVIGLTRILWLMIDIIDQKDKIFNRWIDTIGGQHDQ
jgi:hypothetical protein